MDGPGTLTWEEFVENAESFVLLSNQIRDGWVMLGDKSQPGQAYLSRQVKRFDVYRHGSQNNCSDVDEDWSNKLNSLHKEDPFEAATAVEFPVIVEHHVLWSISYSVPVLYFNGWKSDFPGINPITVEEAQKLITGDSLNYTELSQAIHPILDVPFLQLHPCRSQELLRTMCKSKNKLVSWLSAMAPAALNLDLQMEYCKLTLYGADINGTEGSTVFSEIDGIQKTRKEENKNLQIFS